MGRRAHGVGCGEKACQVQACAVCFHMLRNYVTKEDIWPSGSGARLPVFQ